MKRKALIALVLGIAFTVVPAANAMWLSDGGGSNSSTAILTPQQAQFYAMHGTIPTASVAPIVKLTPRQAQFYVLHGIVPASAPTVSVAPLTTSGDSIAWGRDVALGAAAAVAAMLLAFASVIGVRRRSHRLSF